LPACAEFIRAITERQLSHHVNLYRKELIAPMVLDLAVSRGMSIPVMVGFVVKVSLKFRHPGEATPALSRTTTDLLPEFIDAKEGASTVSPAGLPAHAGAELSYPISKAE
jgi:hypothetical protein